MACVDGLWLCSHGRAHGWDMPQLARRLAAATGEDRGTLPDHETLTGCIRRWEAHRAGISERYELLLAKAFSLDRAEPDVSLPAPQAAGAADDAVNMAELTRHAERSDLGHGTLEALHEVKERLCWDYPSWPADRDKYDFYPRTTWAWLGTDDATAEVHLRLALATPYPREHLVREYRHLVRSARSALPPRAGQQGSGPRSGPSIPRDDARRTRRLPARPGSAARSQAGGDHPPIYRPGP